MTQMIALSAFFVILFLVCVWGLGWLGQTKYFVAICVGLLAVHAVARQPGIIRLLEVPYQALALTVILMGIVWIVTHIREWE